MTMAKADLSDWTPLPFPPAKVLEGRWCRLEPVDPARHLDDIWAAMGAHDDLWRYMPAVAPQTKEVYGELLAGMAAKPGIVPFAVIDKADGRAKGHLWLMEIRPEHGVFEVGYITYSPSLQRTRVATEAIHLCGAYGFSLGYRRFEWKCNDNNEPSKRAALRYGFRYEGLFRQHMVVKGENRDTAWFSILDSEWPLCAAAFERWLDEGNFDAGGRQKVGLAVFNQMIATEGDVTLRRASPADAAAISALKSAAYLPNEGLIGATSLPRLADYGQMVVDGEVWVIDGANGEDLDAALALTFAEGPGHLHLYSIAVSPRAQGRKLGGTLMAFAERRSQALGYAQIGLMTNQRLIERIDWYRRLGYAETHREERPDRVLVHMKKTLDKTLV
jgi:RimJ/RimL family protein N-acetyltransferase/ribosomal protein S18 acetylase RimI-like enzyme